MCRHTKAHMQWRRKSTCYIITMRKHKEKPQRKTPSWRISCTVNGHVSAVSRREHLAIGLLVGAHGMLITVRWKRKIMGTGSCKNADSGCCSRDVWP